MEARTYPINKPTFTGQTGSINMHLERLIRKKLQIFNLHYKMKIGKKFITKKILTVNLISFLIFSY
jgi:hypothetical protein